MEKYRTKPITIEAVQWFLDSPHPKVSQSPYNDDVKEWTFFDQKGDTQTLQWDEGWIETLEGGHIVSQGDYIVKGTHGEFYAVKPDIFLHKYEKLDSEEDTIYIDEDEMAEHIKNKLVERGVILEDEDISQVLELELDFLKMKGIVQED